MVQFHGQGEAPGHEKMSSLIVLSDTDAWQAGHAPSKTRPLFPTDPAPSRQKDAKSLLLSINTELA